MPPPSPTALTDILHGMRGRYRLVHVDETHSVLLLYVERLLRACGCDVLRLRQATTMNELVLALRPSGKLLLAMEYAGGSPARLLEIGAELGAAELWELAWDRTPPERHDRHDRPERPERGDREDRTVPIAIGPTVQRRSLREAVYAEGQEALARSLRLLVNRWEAAPESSAYIAQRLRGDEADPEQRGLPAAESLLRWLSARRSEHAGRAARAASGRPPGDGIPGAGRPGPQSQRSPSQATSAISTGSSATVSPGLRAPPRTGDHLGDRPLFLLIGAPGSGKSTLLRHFAVSLAREHLAELAAHPRLPHTRAPLLCTQISATTGGVPGAPDGADGDLELLLEQAVPGMSGKLARLFVELGLCVLLVDQPLSAVDAAPPGAPAPLPKERGPARTLPIGVLAQVAQLPTLVSGAPPKVLVSAEARYFLQGQGEAQGGAAALIDEAVRSGWDLGYLEPLTDEQVGHFLQLRMPDPVQRSAALAQLARSDNLRRLCRRPGLLHALTEPGPDGPLLGSGVADGAPSPPLLALHRALQPRWLEGVAGDRRIERPAREAVARLLARRVLHGRGGALPWWDLLPDIAVEINEPDAARLLLHVLRALDDTMFVVEYDSGSQQAPRVRFALPSAADYFIGEDLAHRLDTAPVGQVAACLQRPHQGAARAVALSLGGRLCLTGGEDGALKLWECQSGLLLRSISAHRDPVTAVVFLPEDRRCASASLDMTVRLWDTGSGRLLHTLVGHSDGVTALATARGLLASGSADGAVRIYGLQEGRCLQALLPPIERVGALALSADAVFCAVSGDGPLVYIYHVRSGELTTVLGGHSGAVRALSFSPDGRLCASGGEDRSVRLSDVRSGLLLQALHGHEGPVASVAFSPDGRLLASGGQERALRVYRLPLPGENSPARLLSTMSEHQGPLRGLAFLPAQPFLPSAWPSGRTTAGRPASSEEDGRVQPSSTEPTAPHSLPVSSRAVASAATVAAPQGRSRPPLRRSAPPRAPSRRPPPPPPTRQTPEGLTDSGPLLPAPPTPPGRTQPFAPPPTPPPLPPREGTLSRPPRRRSTDSLGNVITVVALPGSGELPSSALTGLIDPNLLAASTLSPSVLHASVLSPLSRDEHGVDPSAATLPREDGARRSQPPRALGESATSAGILLFGGVREPRAPTPPTPWDTPTASQTSGRADAVDATDPAWGRGGRHKSAAPRALAPSGISETILLEVDALDLLEETPAPPLTPPPAPQSPANPTSAAETQTTALLATCGDDGVALLWDAGRGHLLRALDGGAAGGSREEPPRQRCLALSPDGALALTGAEDGALRLWDLRSGALSRVLRGHDGEVLAVAFAPDGRSLASGGIDQTVRLWDLAGDQIDLFEGHFSDVTTLCFSPDGYLLASGSADQTVRLREVGSGLTLHTLPLGAALTQVLFTPNGRHLLCAAADGRVRTMSSAGGPPLRTLSRHLAAVRALALSPDGRLLATASEDQLARIWDQSSGRVLRTLAGHLGAVCAAAFSPDGGRLATVGDEGQVRLWDVRSGEPLGVLSGTPKGPRALAYLPDRESRSGSAVADRESRSGSAGADARLLCVAADGLHLWHAPREGEGRYLGLLLPLPNDGYLSLATVGSEAPPPHPAVEDPRLVLYSAAPEVPALLRMTDLLISYPVSGWARLCERPALLAQALSGRAVPSLEALQQELLAVPRPTEALESSGVRTGPYLAGRVGIGGPLVLTPSALAGGGGSGSMVRLYTADELLRAEGSARGELVRGALVPVSPSPFRPGRVSGRLHALLGSHVYPRNLGELPSADTGYLLQRDPDLLRAPDISFVTRERAAQGGSEGFFTGAPDLAIEVVSPSNVWEAVEQKAQEYLAAGTRLVWVLDTETRTVQVHQSPVRLRILGEGDLLSGAPVLPGFQVRVRDLFD